MQFTLYHENNVFAFKNHSNKHKHRQVISCCFQRYCNIICDSRERNLAIGQRQAAIKRFTRDLWYKTRLEPRARNGLSYTIIQATCRRFQLRGMDRVRQPIQPPHFLFFPLWCIKLQRLAHWREPKSYPLFYWLPLSSSSLEKKKRKKTANEECLDVNIQSEYTVNFFVRLAF